MYVILGAITIFVLIVIIIFIVTLVNKGKDDN